MEGCRPSQGKCLVSGITGAPGAGKSTLINALIRHYRSLKRSVAVISVDPSSPASGGSLLGDRLRMSEHACDEGVFIRSVAARGHLGGRLQRGAAHHHGKFLAAQAPDQVTAAQYARGKRRKALQETQRGERA